MYELRDYQAEAIEKTRERLAQDYRPIVCAATGSGKTIMAGHLAKEAMSIGKRVLFMSGRREILRQTFDVFEEICGRDRVGFLMAGEGPWWFYPPVTVASWDTLKTRWNKADSWHVPADVVLIDECHLALSDKMSRTILPHYESSTVIGFTATPARRSGRGLGSYFTRIIQVRGVEQLIDDGHLAPCEYYAGRHADVAKVRTINGDFETSGLSAAVNDSVLIGDVVDNWLKHARDRHSIVFAVDIAHAEALTRRFQAIGVAAEVVHSKMAQATRSRITEQFKARAFDVLVNVGIATYGYDVPSVSCVVLARPTKSIVLHLQMIGRGMRPKQDGGYCKVLDHADNVRRLGCAEDPFRWRLDAGKKAAVNWARHEANPKRDEAMLTECAECHHLFIRSRVCPRCGWEKPAMARDVEVIDAELVKIRKSRGKEKIEEIDRREWYRQALGYARMHGKKDGLAFHVFLDKFGEKPPYRWRFLEPLEPDQRVINYFVHRAIRYAKRRQRQEARA